MGHFKNRGQGLVEFALVLPVLVLILLGIAEGAHVIQAYIAAQNAVKDAARYAVSGKPLNATGDPWTLPPEQRVNYIEQVAIKSSAGTAYTRVITDVTQYDTFLDRANCDATCAGVLGIRVDWIEYDVDGNERIVQANHPGIEGSDVKISLYNNVALFDPIYAAMVPNGYLTIQASIVMRNEGGKPITGAPPPFTGGGGSSPGSGSGGPNTNPLIEIQDGQNHPAGETIYIRIRQHNANTTYNIYVDNLPVGLVSTDAQGNGIIAYTIPLNKPVGTYTVESRALDGTQIASTFLTVTQPILPAIITNEDILPFGSVLTYSLVSHAPLTTYNIDLQRNGLTVDNLNSLSTDANGISAFPAAYESYTIPNNGSLAEGTYILRSTVTSTTAATHTLTLREGCIKINQGDCGEPVTVPNGVYLNILVQKHSPYRDYIIKLHNTDTGADTIIQPAQSTDAIGNIYLVYALPDTLPDGNYVIQTEDAQYPGAVIAQTPVVVSTPPTPFIAVVGGYSWPAGSTIEFQLRNHAPNTQYDIFWEDQLIIANAPATDANGFLSLRYTIPDSTPQGFDYTLQSKPHSTNPVSGNYTAQSPDIEVISNPYLRIAQGNTQVPGAPVTVELHNHNINNQYYVYVEEEGSTSPGRALPYNPVTTDGVGNGSIRYDIPSNLSPGSVVTVTSYLASQSPMTPTAQTVIQLLAADLQVLNIETPPIPTFNADMPITVTIINAAPVTITHRSFDVDLYLDPPTTPDLGRSLPPGDQKVWLQPPLAYSETRTFTTTLAVYGAHDHNLWVRADTSNRIPEGQDCDTNPSSNECNNLASITISPPTCALEYINAAADAEGNNYQFVNWTSKMYGDADEPQTIPGTPRIRLTNAGGSTNTTDDTASGSGHYFVYRTITSTTPLPPPPPAGNILREWWTNISGSAISDLTSDANYPDNPSGSDLLTSFEAPSNWADNYGTRIRGYVYPPTTGTYTFWIASNNAGELWLSTDEHPANASRIAYVPDGGWTGSREWTKYSSQQSTTISLVGGQLYYIEALQKEASGGDNIAVAWQGPGLTRQVIDGAYLSPWTGIAPRTNSINQTSAAPTMEVGTFTNVTDQFQQFNLQNTYNRAVIVATVNYDSSLPPAVVRLRNINNNNVEVKVQSPSNQTLSGGYTVHYIAVEEGTYTTAANGIKMEAYRIMPSSNVVDRKNNWHGIARNYQNSYNQPVVLGQVSSFNDSNWSVFWARGSSRGQPPTNSNLYIGKHIGEDPTRARNNEELGYIVFEAGSGTIGGLNYTVAVGADTVRGVGNSPPYQYSISGVTNPAVAILSSAGIDGNDGSWPLLYGATPINGSTLYLAVDEDQLGDNERRHTTEQVAYAVFGTTPTAPEINVTGNGVDIVNNDTTPAVADDTDFGTVALGNSVNHTFTIENTGNGTLTISGITLSGANAADFSIVNQPTSIAAGSSDVFVVQFAPTATGARSATVVINNNDSNENPYQFAIGGNGNNNASASTQYEVQTRLLATDTTVSGVWGIEIRADNTGSGAMVQLAYVNHTIQYTYRDTNGTPVVGTLQSGVPHPGTTPVWVRIVKNGQNISLYTATDDGQSYHTAWGTPATFTVSGLQTANLAGMFASSGNAGTIGNFDYDNFKICTLNSDCGSGSVIYRPTYDTATIHTELNDNAFGDAATTAHSYAVVSTSQNDFEPFTVAADGTITMHNDGSRPTDDDDANGGYQFAYHPISGNFDVRVRAISQQNYDDGSTLNSDYAKFGLEVRASLASTSDKLLWAKTLGNQLQYWTRISGYTSNHDNIGSNNLPVWLRIVRSDDNFTLYYSYDTDTPPTNWVEVASVSIASMPESIYLGLLNSPYSSSKKNIVTLDHYHVCTLLDNSTSCSAVRESNELVVVDASTASANLQHTYSYGWQAAARSGKLGFRTADNGNYTPGYDFDPNAPELQYNIDFTNAGTYYVWVLGYAPHGGSNSIYIGLTGSTPSDNIEFTDYNTFSWSNSLQHSGAPATISIGSVGRSNISIWMREDGTEIYQFILTTDPDFVPSTSATYAQSQCSDTGVPNPPPGLLDCRNVIQNGNFEDDTLMSLWHYAGIAEQVTRTSLPHYFAPGESFSMLLPDTEIAGLPRHPWLYQNFNMPTWVLTPTLANGGTELNLTLHAAVNPEGNTDPADHLLVAIQDQTGNTLAEFTPQTITTGDTPPYIDPNNPNPDNSDWVQYQFDLADNFSPAESLLNYKSQQLRLNFYAPNPNDTASTRFYLDNVDLQICTQQPIPTQYTTKVSGDVRVFINGEPTEKPGVNVWIYAIDGSLSKTYTIQDSTFSFYDLPADNDGTQYVLYAEYWENDTFYSASTVIVLKPGQTIDDISLLLF